MSAVAHIRSCDGGTTIQVLIEDYVDGALSLWNTYRVTYSIVNTGLQETFLGCLVAITDPENGVSYNYLTTLSGFQLQISQDCPNCIPETRNKQLTFSSCDGSTNTVIIVKDSGDLIVGDVVEFIGQIGCWQLVGITDSSLDFEYQTVNELVRLKHSDCKSCIGDSEVIQEKYERITNKQRYYPKQEFNCDEDIIDTIISKVNNIFCKIYNINKYLLYFDRDSIKNSSWIREYIDYRVLLWKEQLKYQGCTCKEDLGTCCPPCSISLVEVFPNTCIGLAGLDIHYIPDNCMKLDSIVVDQIESPQCMELEIELVSPPCLGIHNLEIQIN